MNVLLSVLPCRPYYLMLKSESLIVLQWHSKNFLIHFISLSSSVIQGELWEPGNEKGYIAAIQSKALATQTEVLSTFQNRPDQKPKSCRQVAASEHSKAIRKLSFYDRKAISPKSRSGKADLKSHCHGVSAFDNLGQIHDYYCGNELLNHFRFCHQGNPPMFLFIIAQSHQELGST